MKPPKFVEEVDDVELTVEHRLILGVVVEKLIDDAQAALNKLRTLKGGDRTKAVVRQIEYWQNVRSALRWAHGRIHQLKKVTVARGKTAQGRRSR